MPPLTEPPMPRAALRPLALALLLAAAGAHAGTTHVPRTQVPGVYHQQIGDVRVTALFDGTVALPRQALTGIAPILVPLAATGLVIVMIGAIITHARRKENQAIGINAVLLALAAFVALGRFALAPFGA